MTTLAIEEMLRLTRWTKTRSSAGEWVSRNFRFRFIRAKGRWHIEAAGYFTDRNSQGELLQQWLVEVGLGPENTFPSRRTAVAALALALQAFPDKLRFALKSPW